MKLGSLFSGIGAFELAAARNGIEPVWASEIEPRAVSIHYGHFPAMRQYGDIRKIDGTELEPVDIITFGSPCQNLSVAGDRTGLGGSQSRLFHEAIRVIKNHRRVFSKPRYILWENVPGAFSRDGGKDFKEVLQEIVKVKDPQISIPEPKKWLTAGSIVGDGFSLAWRVLDAQYWGVPQRRKRIFLVADFGGERASEILFKPESLFGSVGSCKKEGEDATTQAQRGVGSTIPINVNALKGPTGRAGGLGVGDQGDPAPSLQAGYQHAVYVINDQDGVLVEKRDLSPTLRSGCHGSLPIIKPLLASGAGTARTDSSTDHVVLDGSNLRRLTPLECERLMGFPDYWTLYGRGLEEIKDTPRYRALGNSIVVPCLEYIFKNLIDDLDPIIWDLK